MAAPGQAAAPASGRAARIGISGVERVYASTRSSVTALHDLTTEVPGGQFLSLLGPSGCGKSTLLRLIAGLEHPTSGTIEVGGTTVTAPHPDLGMVFQEDLLMPWRTVIDNILLQADVRRADRKAMRDRARELLAQVGLEACENKYPRELSGGMRQRVGICRAILHDPRLLLMDEPFAALDAMTRDQMAVDLADMAAQRDTTVVFVTHSISEAVFLSDRILVMSPRPGRVVADITVDLPRPRGLHVRETPRFADYVGQVTEVFEDLGILRDRRPAGHHEGTQR
ncbi:ABC transporter ATP-binding protein [Nocardiopsis ansamitocini]|uniref:ABC transporter ATP-binding protein n=1 Tax=Nocardiopsis ansamitocini TaxID=1670832 RepID=A0A9W6P849_9ACTN|nr:ABC transporter ATP-binding protein [Nocardiopsis ansamitocini]GLU48743.1 ABC transporter ATP-binding protein [Nocardiopsis ansamitocini]